MTQRLFLVVLLWIVGSSSFSQTPHKFIRAEVNSIPTQLILDPTEVRNALIDGLPDSYHEGDNARLTKLYADNVAHGMASRLTNGRVYSNWPEMDDYIQKVIDNVIPKELKEAQNLKAFVYKDGDFNASMHATGIMNINVGTWTYLESESELAALIAHELAHYYCHHSVNTFIKSRNGGFDYGLGGESKKLIWAESQKNELQADSLAYIWLSDSPYAMSGASELLYLLQRLENHRIKRMKNRWDFKATSHPLSDDRIALLQKVKGEQMGEGLQFIQEQSLFEKLKKAATVEALEIKLRDFEFRTGIEMAFKQHILDSESKVYIYYLMENIRRLCYQDNDYWTKDFIIDGYYEEKVNETQDNKVDIKRHLFEQFDPHVMSMAPSELRRIQGRFYWEGDMKFRTYEEAFMFFYQVGEMMDCEECYFSEALSQVSDSTARKTALEKYLATPSPMYAEEARMMLDETVFVSLDKKKLTVFNEFEAFINQGQDPIPVNIQHTGSSNDLLQGIIDSAMVRHEDRTPVYLNSLRNGQLPEYMLLHELKILSRKTFVSKGVKPELHIMDPRYIRLFKKYGVEEIEFVECRYTEFKKAQNSAAAYDALMDMSYDRIINKSDATRFFEVYLSSVRTVEEGRMKYQYYSGEIKFKFKDASKEQIVKSIRSELYGKEDRMKKDHFYYRRM